MLLSVRFRTIGLQTPSTAHLFFELIKCCIDRNKANRIIVFKEALNKCHFEQDREVYCIDY